MLFNISLLHSIGLPLLVWLRASLIKKYILLLKSDSILLLALPINWPPKEGTDTVSAQPGPAAYCIELKFMSPIN